MPTHIRAHVIWQVGSLLPRDVAQITPCFRHQAGLVFDSPDWQDLADDLADAMHTSGSGTINKQLTVKLYEIKDVVPGEPNRPRAVSVKNPGLFQLPTIPTEVAMCLSFYGGPNAPHNRGRLYLPAWYVAGDSGPLALRPAAAHRNVGGTVAAALAALGGINVDWIVWSPTREAATRVEHWWVDDEWDTQRRRGQKATARTMGDTSG